MTTYPPYQRQLSPTAGAVQFFVDLKAAGLNPINLGQGRETESAPAEIFAPFIQGNADNPTISPVYNSQCGGEAETREAAAGYIQRFLNIPATAENTFVLQSNGRAGLVEGLRFASARTTGTDILLPEHRWPMYDMQVKSFRGYQITEYPNPVEEYNDILSAASNPAAIVTNSPHNPTGKIYSPAFYEGLADALEERNKDNTETFHILDLPYFYALPNDGGFAHVTKLDSKTPWIAVISFSKALGAARPGLTFVVVHPDIAKDFKNHLISTIGMSYDVAFYGQVAQAFQPQYDDIHKSHFATLRTKYEANWAALNAALPSESIMDGDAGMTALIKMGDDVFGKTIKSAKTGPRAINSTEDFVEFLGHEYEVVTVSNGVGLLRVANSAAPDVYAEAIGRIKEGLAQLSASQKNAA